MTKPIERGTDPRPFGVDVAVTLEDQMAFNTALAAQPEVARRRRIWAVVSILPILPIGLACGLVSTMDW